MGVVHSCFLSGLLRWGVRPIGVSGAAARPRRSACAASKQDGAAEAPPSGFSEAARYMPQPVNAISYSSGKASRIVLAAAASRFPSDLPTLLVTLDKRAFATFREAGDSAFAVHVLTANERERAETIVRTTSQWADAAHDEYEFARTATLSLSSESAADFRLLARRYNSAI